MFQITKISMLMLFIGFLNASPVILTVNGKDFTKSDVEEFLKASAPNLQFDLLQKSQKELVLSKLAEKYLFMELAKKQKIQDSKEFKDNLEKVMGELVVSIWMKKQMDSIIISDSEAKDFYEKNKSQLVEKAKVRARHILVKEEKEAKEIIDALISLKGEILKDTFIFLAKDKSIGPSKSSGGDLGEFQKGQMVKPFSNAVWSLEVGTITKEPVKTQFGYHVIYLEDKKGGEITKYEDVKEKIINSLKQQKFNMTIQKIANELTLQAKIIKNLK